jgi:hypothetical protein
MRYLLKEFDVRKNVGSLFYSPDRLPGAELLIKLKLPDSKNPMTNTNITLKKIAHFYKMLYGKSSYTFHPNNSNCMFFNLENDDAVIVNMEIMAKTPNNNEWLLTSTPFPILHLNNKDAKYILSQLNEEQLALYSSYLKKYYNELEIKNDDDEKIPDDYKRIPGDCRKAYDQFADNEKERVNNFIRKHPEVMKSLINRRPNQQLEATESEQIQQEEIMEVDNSIAIS